ncbi:ComF family protein [Streptomyces sp. NPDC058371]|uniref:ComF family protein n=1 Tax=Streptomyces sp. NPDC058371 TaxID=3346463 RepID=UPI003665D99C
MRGWWQDLTDLVLPAECGGCGRPRTVLCPECRAALHGSAPCRVRPEPEPAGLPVVHAAAPYEDEVRAVLLAHKERGALALTGPLGAALAGAVRAGLAGSVQAGTAGPVWAGPDERPECRAAGPVGALEGVARASRGPVAAGPSGAARGPVVLVPVPSARGAVRARGHDPARRIALAAAGELRRTGTAARVLGALRQRRAVADQSGLNSRQRMANLAGALEVAAGGAGLLAGAGRVVLVDDLMTTGASLAEAARAVRAALTEAAEAVEGAEAAVGARVYGSGTREATGVRIGEAAAGVADMAADRTHADRRATDAVTARVGICAAVVAASPDAFEINRN